MAPSPPAVVLDQHRQRPLDPLHLPLRQFSRPSLGATPRPVTVARRCTIRPLGPDRRGPALELLVEDLPARDPDPVVCRFATLMMTYGRVDVDVDGPAAAKGVPDGGPESPPGITRALPTPAGRRGRNWAGVRAAAADRLV